MHHYPVGFADDERSCAQPREQLFAVRRVEDRVQRVVTVWPAVPRSDSQQMEIVISEDRNCRTSHRPHRSQHAERVRPAIHQVADQPQTVAGCIEPDQIQKLPKFRVATLDIADDIVTHGRGCGRQLACDLATA